MEYEYQKNPLTLTEVMFDFVRGIIQTICPLFKLAPFSALLDKLFASKLARSLLGSYAMLLLM